ARPRSESRNLRFGWLCLCCPSGLRMSGRRRGFVRRSLHLARLKSRRSCVGGGQFGTRETRGHLVTLFCSIGIASRRDDRKPSVRLDQVFRQSKAPREQNRYIILAVANTILGRLAKP